MMRGRRVGAQGRKARWPLSRRRFRSLWCPHRRTLDNVDKMVFEFPDAQSRNLAGRALRSAGFVCFASGPKVREQACLLTVDEQLVERRSAVTQLVRDTAPVGQLQ